MPYTLAQLHTRTRDVLNEATAAFWTDLQIDTWLGDAAADISGLVKCVEATDTRAMALSTPDYALPADSVEVLHVQAQATGRGLIKLSPSSAGHRSASSTGDDPEAWWEWNGRVYIEPIPNGNMVGKNILLFYARVTQDVTLLPEWCQLLAIDYALYRAKEKDRHYAEAAMIYGAYLNGLILRSNTTYQRAPQTEADVKVPGMVANG